MKDLLINTELHSFASFLAARIEALMLDAQPSHIKLYFTKAPGSKVSMSMVCLHCSLQFFL